MKVIVVLAVLIGLGIGAMYLWGGYKSFDPDKEGRAAKAAITPGMNWKQVVKVAGDNPKLQLITFEKRKIGGQVTEQRKVGPPFGFTPDKVAKGISSGTYKDGFILHYMFSEQVCFNVECDGTGVVLAVEDVATMADLLGTRKH